MNNTHLRRRELALVAILLAAAALRLVALDTVPPGPGYDELQNARLAGRVLVGRWAIYFPENHGQEPLYPLLEALAVRALGWSGFSIRLPGALAGVLATLGVAGGNPGAGVNSMELYLIRHGQSTNNALADERERVCDPPLTELGWRQSERLAEHLADGRRGYGITRLYTSPMWRALQTAKLVGQALGLPVEVWIELHESGGVYLDHGEVGGIVAFPGKTRFEVVAGVPGLVLPERVTEEGWWRGEGREDWPACQGRAIRVESSCGSGLRRMSGSP